MTQILTAAQMKAADENTIKAHGIPSLVLMERAALGVVSSMKKRKMLRGKILCICGTGNNGADGVAIARLLFLMGKNSTVLLLGSSEKRTVELKQQIDIAKSYGVEINEFSDLSSGDFLEILNTSSTIVDAIFGIGLCREVTGNYAKVIEDINSCKAKKVAVDIPSGYSADDGNVLGIGVMADLTVTFSYSKKGLLLSDCYKNSGELVLKDVGIFLDEDIPTCKALKSSKSQSDTLTQAATDSNIKRVHEITDRDLKRLPRRSKAANKGSLGKLLIIAGSIDVYGACFLSALAAARMGAGYIKIVTHKNNLPTLQDKLPEAVVISYDEKCDISLALKSAMDWSDAILIGPGLGMSDYSKSLLKTVLTDSDKPLVIDADGINLLASDSSLMELCKKDASEKLSSVTSKRAVIITPHLLEMSRLCGKTVSEIDKNMEDCAHDFSINYGLTVLLKNYTSVITNGQKTFINSSGDEALATAGSGDVLAGIVAALLSFGTKPLKAAALGAYIHGKAGKAASAKLGSKNILASEIANNILI